MQHTSAFQKLVNKARVNIKELSVSQVKDKLDAKEDFLFVDVREDNEVAKGKVIGATHIGKGVIERDIANFATQDKEIVLYCGGGFRSALAADNLLKMGYKNVISMDGGYKAWVEHNYPVEK